MTVTETDVLIVGGGPVGLITGTCFYPSPHFSCFMANRVSQLILLLDSGLRISMLWNDILNRRRRRLEGRLRFGLGQLSCWIN